MIALGLLVLASFDLGLPGLCNTEQAGDAFQLTVGWEGTTKDFGRTDDDAPVQDDCFCCCAHLLTPLGPPVMGALAVESLVASPLVDVSRGRADALFHPPRA